MGLTGGTVTGNITLNGNAVRLRWGTGAFIQSSNKQQLFFGATENEDERLLLLGVAESRWALRPAVTGNLELGSPNYKWSNIYATNGTIQTSDKNNKGNIKPLTDQHYQLLMKLLPVSYTFINGTSGRTHVGFISQDVEQAMGEVGLTDLDFAGFCKDVKMWSHEEKYIDTETYIDEETGEEKEREVEKTRIIEEPVLDNDGNPIYMYSLRYDEFIAIIAYALQRTIKRQDEQESRLTFLENKINELVK